MRLLEETLRSRSIALHSLATRCMHGSVPTGWYSLEGSSQRLFRQSDELSKPRWLCSSPLRAPRSRLPWPSAPRQVSSASNLLTHSRSASRCSSRRLSIRLVTRPLMPGSSVCLYCVFSVAWISCSRTCCRSLIWRWICSGLAWSANRIKAANVDEPWGDDQSQSCSQAFCSAVCPCSVRW